MVTSVNGVYFGLMKYVTTVKDYGFDKPSPKYVLVICGHGGKVWQTKRLVRTLMRDGYAVKVVDHTADTLSTGDPSMLPGLIDEVYDLAVEFQENVKAPVLIIGFSLGGLIAMNIVRKDKRFDRAIFITGGDIAKAVLRLSSKDVWPQSYEELAKIWEPVNMYSQAGALDHASMVMIFPIKDQLVDIEDVRNEAKKHKRFVLIEPRHFAHAGTVVDETILRPKRVLKYIRMLDE